MIADDGKALDPLYGPGLTGLSNLGNRCVTRDLSLRIIKTYFKAVIWRLLPKYCLRCRPSKPGIYHLRRSIGQNVPSPFQHRVSNAKCTNSQTASTLVAMLILGRTPALNLQTRRSPILRPLCRRSRKAYGPPHSSRSSGRGTPNLRRCASRMRRSSSSPSAGSSEGRPARARRGRCG